jgi:putative two-component system response regulator
VAEDTPDLRNYVVKILSRLGHQVVSAENGQVAWDLLNSDPTIDILVTDIMMPKMDGYELLEAVRNDPERNDLPVIMITAKAGDDPKLKALGIGADDYLPKPINVREMDARIHNLLTSRDLRRSAAESAALAQRVEDLRMSFAQTLEMRDAETGTHSKEVLDIGIRIARELNLEIDQTLKDSLLLHDIGKIGIPDGILLKDGPLTPEESSVMQRHAEFGKVLLESFSNFQDVSEIILAHQEHWDGSGYPNGLSGDDIPMIARIIAVADAFHAMTNSRPYRDALTEADAVAELKQNSGSQFDPQIVDAFLKIRGLD